MPASFHWGNCGEHQRTDHNGLAVAGSKIGAAASATAATYSPGYTLSDWALTGAIVFGLVGLGAFRFGRKNAQPLKVWIGVALMLYPYAVSRTWLLYVIGFALCAALFIERP